MDNKNIKSAAVDAALKTKNKININRGMVNTSSGNLFGRGMHYSKPISNSLVGGMNDLSSVDEQDGYDDTYADSDSNNEIKGQGIVSGLWKVSSLKTKLIIIGLLFAVISLIMFLVVLITPLMELDIIDISGVGSSTSHAYVSPTYAYCESINVDGKLYDLDEYVAGVIEAEFGSYLSTGVEEALKVQAIAARTYALYHTNGCKKSMDSNNNTQKFTSNYSSTARKIANDTTGLVLSYDNDLFLSKYDTTNNYDCSVSEINVDGSYTVTYNVLPNMEKNTIILNDSNYYNKIVSGEIKSRDVNQYVSFKKDNDGMSYEEIIDISYSDGVEIVNLKNLLVGNIGAESGSDYIGTYTNVKNGKTYKNYKQYLYKSNAFTFKGKDHLANVGCGTNAAAIVLSGEDNSITPQKLYIENGYAVGIYFGNYYSRGTSVFNYCDSWNNGYCTKTKNDTKISNNQTKDKLVSNLSNGGTAILFINYSADKCMVNGESWTGSQHYFTALDYNPVDNTIYISNPGNNSGSQNGWISLDEFDCVHIAVLLYP